MRIQRPYSEVGKFLAIRCVEENLSRAELCVRLRLAPATLSDMMHKSKYSRKSIDKVITEFGDRITEEEKLKFYAGVEPPKKRFSFQVPEDTVEWKILNRIQTAFEQAHSYCHAGESDKAEKMFEELWKRMNLEKDRP